MMTPRNRFLVTTLLGILLAGGAFAADEAKPAEPLSAERQLEMLTNALTLTPEQSGKVMPLLERDQKKVEALRGDKSISVEDRRAKRWAMAQARMEEIRAILTPEQEVKFKKLMEARRQAWEKRSAEATGKAAAE